MSPRVSGRYYPKEFARFLIAIGSLHETKTHLHDGYARHYLSETKYEQLIRLTLRAIKAGNRFLAYLLRSTTPDPLRRPSDNKP